MDFLKVAGREIRNIFSNKMVRISLIPLLGVPVLYSLIYLSAFWDPYGKLEKFPVAIVNLDKGTTVDDDEKNFGEEIVKEFKDNKDMEWHFTDEKDADEGLEGKKYYVKILIPKDFSKRLVSAQEGKPLIANLKITTNPKKNYIGAQIGSSLETKLKENITANITKNTVQSSFDVLFDIKDGLVTAADGSSRLSDGLGELNKNTPNLSKGVEAIANGLGALLGGQTKLNAGVGQISGGLKEINGNIPILGEGVDKLYSGSIGLKDGLQVAGNGANQLSQGSKSLYDGFKENIYPAVYQLKIGANKLNKALESASEDTQRPENSPTQLKDNGEKIAKSSNSILSGYGEVENNVDALGETSASTTKGMESIVVDLQKALESGDKGDIESALKKVQALSFESRNNLEKINELKKGTASFSSSLKEYSNEVQDFTKSVNRYKSSSGEPLGQAPDNMEEIAKGINQMSSALNALEKGLNEKNPGSFGSGLKIVSDNTAVLNSGISRLGSGAEGINGGLSELKSNVPMLANGINALYTGSVEMGKGSNDLLDGQTKLGSGVKEMESNIPSLVSGVTELYDGSKELSEKLGEGASSIGEGLKNPSDVMAEFIKEPVDISNERVNPVDNYGTVFAPYIMPLSLWIGALLILMVMASKNDKNMITSKFHGVVGKYLGLGLVAILQAVLTGACVMTLGLRPTNLPLFFLLMMLFSLVFLSIIYCLMSLLGQAGNLFAMIILILQLVGSEGTFPIELQPPFIHAINPFLPFTYVIEALREVISATTINYSVIGKDVLVLSIMGLIFLALTIIFKKQDNTEVNEVASSVKA